MDWDLWNCKPPNKLFLLKVFIRSSGYNINNNKGPKRCWLSSNLLIHEQFSSMILNSIAYFRIFLGKARVELCILQWAENQKEFLQYFVLTALLELDPVLWSKCGGGCTLAWVCVFTCECVGPRVQAWVFWAQENVPLLMTVGRGPDLHLMEFHGKFLPLWRFPSQGQAQWFLRDLYQSTWKFSVSCSLAVLTTMATASSQGWGSPDGTLSWLACTLVWLNSLWHNSRSQINRGPSFSILFNSNSTDPPSEPSPLSSQCWALHQHWSLPGECDLHL